MIANVSKPVAHLADLLSFGDPRCTRVTLAAPWGGSIDGCGQPGMYVVRSGRASIVVGDETWTLSPGDLVLLPASPTHALADSVAAPLVPVGQLMADAVPTEKGMFFDGGGEPTELFTLAFGEADPGRHLARWLQPVLHVRSDDLDRSTRLVVDALVEECLHEPSVDSVYAARLAEVIWLKVMTARLPAIATADPAVLRAAATVFAAPAESFDVARMARIASLSRSRFVERFTAAFGEPPMRFVGRVRMQEARKLLASGLSVGDVAERLGYASEPAFRRAFRRIVGRPARAL